MIDIIGYIAGFCLAISSVPQVIKCYKEKTAKGLANGMLTLWSIGIFGMTFYVLWTTNDLPLIFNYCFNSLLVGTLVYFKLKYK